MIDVKDLRERTEIYRENMKKKFQDSKFKFIDEALDLDSKWRKIKYEEDKLRSERNKVSEEINKAKKAKDEKKAKELIKKAKEIPEKVAQLTEKRKVLEDKLRVVLSEIPNIISKRVPIGKDDSENVVEKVLITPEKKNFELKSHVEIAEALGCADFDSSARVAGNGFYYLQGDLALLNRALINFTIDYMASKGFLYVETPLMLRNEIIDNVTDLNDQENMIYRIANDDVSLIGTSEHSLIGRYAGTEVNEKALPIKQTSYSMCFRKEIGSRGVDEKGLFRTHQFNKVEMIVVCEPSDSEKFFEELKGISVDILKKLKLPSRILKICSGDLGNLKYEQVDLEVYSPRKGNYFEVGSCSNLTDCQARKLGITTRVKGERLVPHTLNNTAMATSRMLVGILENYQNKDGSVSIPLVLQKYMSGKKKIVKYNK